ncbi:MAG: hypothetical protein JWO29_1170 [Arthrobacter sp.]|nr:hypothetical protein [Arthrobacter sp.]
MDGAGDGEDQGQELTLPATIACASGGQRRQLAGTAGQGRSPVSFIVHYRFE